MNWKKVKLGDILTESKIESEKSDPDKRITVRLNIKGVEKRPHEVGVEGGTKYYKRKAGQFIYGKQNLFKGAFGIIPKELNGFESSSDIPTFDIDSECLPEWIYYYLKQNDFYKSLESIATGTGSRRIQPTRLFEIKIPLPSKVEQKEVISKCHKAEKEFELLSQETELQQTHLQQLCQSILQEAVQGKLTKQNKDDEPADELLQRIKAQKPKLITAGKSKNEKKPRPITEDEIPFELPKGWLWCRLGEIGEIVGGIQKTPLRTPVRNIFPYLRVANVQRGILTLNEIEYFELGDGELEKWKLQEGDLLIIEGNGSPNEIGRCAIWQNEIPNCVHQNHLIRLRIYDKISSQLIMKFLNSPFGKSEMKRKAFTTTGLYTLSVSKVSNLIFPLPPLPEQQRIVAKVEQLMQKVNQLEHQVQQSKEQARQLLQSVLKEAFTNNGCFERITSN